MSGTAARADTPYTGHVERGGPAARRDLPGLSVTKLSVGGEWDNNAYLLRCRETGQQLLVDAADDAERILTVVGPAGLTTVVTTHRHHDHWRALDAVVQATGARTAAGGDDVGGIGVATDEPLADGDLVRVGRCDLHVVHLVGHTPGSIALRHDAAGGGSHLFTGDSLFPGGPGRTAGPAEFGRLMDDLETKVFGVLGDDTWVYPGHGDDTTLGAERGQLATWRARGW